MVFLRQTILSLRLPKETCRWWLLYIQSLMVERCIAYLNYIGSPAFEREAIRQVPCAKAAPNAASESPRTYVCERCVWHRTNNARRQGPVACRYLQDAIPTCLFVVTANSKTSHLFGWHSWGIPPVHLAGTTLLCQLPPFMWLDQLYLLWWLAQIKLVGQIELSDWFQKYHFNR